MAHATSASDSPLAAAGARLLVRTRIDDLETPISALLKLDPQQAGSFLFESVVGGEARGRYSFIGLAPDLWWRVQGGIAETATDLSFAPDTVLARSDAPLEDLRRFRAHCEVAEVPGLPPMAAGAFGYLGYEMVRHFERLPEPREGGPAVPEALMMRPTAMLVFDAVRQEILLCAPVRPEDASPEASAAAEAAATARLDAIEARLDGAVRDRPTGAPLVLSFTANLSREAYAERVVRAKAYIEAGDIFQVVPSQRLRAALPVPAVAMYRALRRLNPSPFMFYVNCGDFQIVGASPEILVRVRAGEVTIRPIAGTLPRGATPAEDAANAARLLADPKERAEHMMLLDLGRNDVGRSASPGSVKVTESFVIERYSHVMHIVSNVTGQLMDGLDSLDALMAGFPAGTVSGAPKIRAMEIIHELEPERRGVYGGGVGYFGLDGAADFCIALRTAVVQNGEVFIQSGGGVVYDSDPDLEWQETQHKARALVRAAEEAGRYA